MKRTIIAAYSIFLLMLSQAIFAGATRGQVSSFLEVEKIIDKWGQPTKTLLVMDNDDTLTMMPCPNLEDLDNCQYLGSAAWFSWQRQLLNTSSPYKVADNITHLIDISTLIFAISDMDYTESTLPSILHGLNSKGVRLMVETARSNANVAATTRQFSQLPTETKSAHNLLQLIKSNSLHFTPSGLASLPSPYIPCDIPGARPISYQQGVMYVAGQNKGTMLECMLNLYQADRASGVGMDITHIVFIDDTKKNVDNVFATFKNNKQYTLRALHYNKLGEHKAALTKGIHKDKIQETTHKHWTMIRDALKQNVSKPAAIYN